MAAVVYALCALASLLCAGLLWRGWRGSGARLLLWSSLCFAGLALNNAILFVDRVVITDVDLSLARALSGLLALLVLLYGLIWEND